MLVLQVALRDSQWHIWAERTTDKAIPRAKAHPFAATGDELRDVLTLPNAVGTLETFRLPTTNNRPVASHPTIAEPPAADATIELAEWAVTTLQIPIEPLLELLAESLSEELLRPGVIAGNTLRYWAHVVHYAVSLVAREQFLPSIETDGNKTRACWRVTIGPGERARHTKYLEAMPAACRGMDPTLVSPTVVLNQFLDAMINTLVRNSVFLPKEQKSFKSIHEHWMYALRCRDSAMKVSVADARALAQTIDEWQRPITILNSASYRLCFRLEEPAVEPETFSTSGTWTVRYLLQALNDPSLLVPLPEAWSPSNDVARTIPLPSREFLLMALGQAAKLCAHVEGSLLVAAPDGFTLDSSGAFTFLGETVYLLEQAGFGVLLPSWWTRTGSKNRLSVLATAHTSSTFSSSSNLLSMEQMVQFDWKAAIGDVEMSFEELQAIAAMKASLVLVRGRWVTVDASEIQSAIAFWKKNPQTTGTVRDALRLSIGADTGPAGLQVRGVTTSGGLKTFLDKLLAPGSYSERPPPEHFTGTLRPYQLRGFSWLSFLQLVGLGACLADDMGLGKSVQMLAAIEQAREDGETRPVLLICPTSVVGHWRKEAERFTPKLKVMVHHGQDRKKGATLAKQVKKFGLVISSFSLLQRDATALTAIPWAGVILDEAQAIKNSESKTAQAARKLNAGFRVALTGTPVENHVGDLWSIGQFLNPGFLGSKESFRREFMVPIQMQRDEEATQRLKRLTGPFLLRRLKTDKSIIADLPDKFESKVFCTLTKEQATLYQAVVSELERALKDEAGMRRKGLILGALSKLKQVCNHPAQFLGERAPIVDRSGKVARFTEMMQEVLEAGDRALVFTQFTEMGEILRAHLQDTFGREVMFLHGGVPQPKREKMVERFQNTDAADSPRIFLISLKAGGTGLTLTAANHVFHFDRWWNPAVENQATDRAFRIGQKRNVQVHKFVCIGTLEEKIDEMIERKKEIAGRVVGTGEGWLTEMTNTDLKTLLALRADAVEE